MQHLSMLAWAYGLAGIRARGFRPASVYAREFREQVLDFIATNPPRYGVNWFCTMDVAIRAANWLVARDLFRAFGAQFDHNFELVFTRSVYEHGRHIAANLENSGGRRGNHYLSDIAGLLFTAAYLPENDETNCWLAFAIREVANEMAFQFNRDGSNCEASTGYHRLSTEIMLYSAILCLLLPRKRVRALKGYYRMACGFVPSLRSPRKRHVNYDSPTSSSIGSGSGWRRLLSLREI